MRCSVSAKVAGVERALMTRRTAPAIDVALICVPPLRAAPVWQPPSALPTRRAPAVAPALAPHLLVCSPATWGWPWGGQRGSAAVTQATTDALEGFGKQL